MKKFVYLILTICAASCAKSDLLENLQSGAIAEEQEQDTRSNADGEYDVLGYGYDICGDYLSNKSVKLQVVNIANVIEDYPKEDGYYKVDASGHIGERVTAETDEMEFLKEINKKTNVEASKQHDQLKVSDKKSPFFTGSITVGWSSSSSYRVKSERSHARVESVKRLKTISLHHQLDAAVLKNYLTPTFVRDLNTKSADDIVRLYGTHVLADVSLGGIYRANYNSVILATNTTKKKTVTGGAKITLMGILSFGGGMSQEEATTLNVKNTDWICEVETFGGTQTGTSLIITPNGLSGQTLNLSEWQASVTDKNCVLTDINWEKAYPIFDFVDDPVKKAALKTAVKKHIEDQQKRIVLLDPLFRFYSSYLVDHFYTVRYDEGANNRRYAYEWIEGYVFRNKEAGTVPLYRFYKGGGVDNHFYTKSYSEGINAGYTYEEIIGYVYPSITATGIPLYRYYAKFKKDEDHLYVTDPGREIFGKYQSYGIECYLPRPGGQ